MLLPEEVLLIRGIRIDHSFSTLWARGAPAPWASQLGSGYGYRVRSTLVRSTPRRVAATYGVPCWPVERSFRWKTSPHSLLAHTPNMCRALRAQVPSASALRAQLAQRRARYARIEGWLSGCRVCDSVSGTAALL